MSTTSAPNDARNSRIATAIPAFIGYTARAMFNGKPCTHVPVMIHSMDDFLSVFCEPESPPFAPQYYAVEQKQASAPADIVINKLPYLVLPDPATVYYLYNALRMFFLNGGQTAYIVSCGTYGPSSGSAMDPGQPLVNPNVHEADLLSSLTALKVLGDVTLYVCPDAALLSDAANGTFAQAMLQQCAQLRSAFSLLDVPGGRDPDPVLFVNDIRDYRNVIGTSNLGWGAAYYPFLVTTVIQPTDLDYRNFFGGNISLLAPLLSPTSAPNPEANALLKVIGHPQSDAKTPAQYQAALLSVSATYQALFDAAALDAGTLPPASAMAGIIANVDLQSGVWTAPANTAVTGALSPTMNLSDDQQAGLNVDTVSGKSVNAIRAFPHQGVVIWGARTLDGNNQDWRYINVKRTVIYIEQSCLQVAREYLFQPNDSRTWSQVVSSLSNFLEGFWEEGGLAGPTAASSFMVQCGLGTTMTGEDLLQGIMRISIQVAITHPAEFIVITIELPMQGS